MLVEAPLGGRFVGSGGGEFQGRGVNGEIQHDDLRISAIG